ncbi:MAG: adenosylhomocysteinase [Solirubrobacterales bacterium]|nr:adenosylhomocysteinase [Solirubrobacterales bacterium]MBV9715392.1 adenosylhomocysteinase [Solirubrobacterales bacterium]
MADLSLADAGSARVAWAGDQMPVLGRVRERFAVERPLDGIRLAACLHVTAETANLILALQSGGALTALCSANPLSTQDDVASALVLEHGVQVRALRGESLDTYAAHVRALLDGAPQVTIDDGADLLVTAHHVGGEALAGLIGGTEETTTGLVRLRRLEERGVLACPVLAVNEAHTERALNDRHGTGQSALDGIVRASHVLLAGHTVVVLGYGAAGQGIAERARGAGAAVIVCEVDPLHALEARMGGYDVMPALRAAERGDIFITVTGSCRVLRGEHFERMKDGALLANAGHFDVELDLEELGGLATGGVRQVRPLVEQHTLADGRRLNLLAGGRVVNLAAAEGHPAAVMDVSFALQALCVEELVRRRGELPVGVLQVPAAIDREVGRLKLDALGVEIDEPTLEQANYRESWG